MFRKAPPRPFAALLVALVALLPCLSGCGGGGPPAGEVSGKVTFEGKPVKEGLVSFMSQAGTGDEAQLNSEGAFTITKPLPVGDYKVMVTPLIVRGQDGGKGPEVGIERPAPDIPAKYRVIGTTDLKATVKEGKNQFNFDMKR